MKKFLLLTVFFLSGFGLVNAQGITDVKLTSPKAEQKIRRGLTSIISWDTLDTKGNRTFESTFEFFWAETANATTWNKLQVDKAGNTFKDVAKSKTEAAGKIATVFPVKENLYVKMQLQGKPEVSSVVGPIHIIVPPAAKADSTLTGDITNTITLSSSKIYQLKGVVFVQFGLTYRFSKIADQSNSESFESDNDANATENQPYTSPIFSNITCIGPVRDITNAAGTDYNAKYLAAAQIRRNSRLSLYNSLFIGWPAGLEMTNDNTVKAFGDDLAQVQFNTFIGIKDNKFFYFGSKTKATEKVTADWLKKPEFGNEFINQSGNIANYAKLTNMYPAENQYNTLNLAPVKDASFAPEKLKDTFFEKVAYRGAFSTDITHRWDADWANYDPVNAVYKKSSVENENEVANTTIGVKVTPNPVVSNTLIQYVTPNDGKVSIKLYNELGNLVSVIAEDLFQVSGTYEFYLNAENMPMGVYFLNISNGNYTVTKNINIIK